MRDERRRMIGRILILAAVLLGAPLNAIRAAELPTVKVFKTPTCGCCVKWIAHLEAAGFEVEATDMASLSPVRRTYAIPARLGSCHTAIVDGYIVEGHVPASDILRMLDERPAIKGLAVPGMPAGSPGMEAPNPPPYSVFAFSDDGSIERYSIQRP